MNRAPVIGLLAGEECLAAMLTEWLKAAGFLPVAAFAERCDVLLASWPNATDWSGVTEPFVLLVPAGLTVPPELARQASAIVPLPDEADIKSILRWSKELSALLRKLVDQVLARSLAPSSPPLPQLAASELRAGAPALIALGISTGGPAALHKLFASLRSHQLPPMAIVQHIPPGFLEVLVERIGQESGYRTKVARDGEVMLPGVAYFAPGDQHLRLEPHQGQTVTRLCDDPARRGHRPAVELLFESCATLPLRGVGVIMTGMGQDGAQGLLQLRRLGWATLGQREDSCAIYGMPRAAQLLGAVERELPLEEIGPYLALLCGPRERALRSAQ